MIIINFIIIVVAIVVAIFVANLIWEEYEVRRALKVLEEYGRIMRGEDE